MLADKVVRVFTISGDVVYLILGIEFLGYRDPAFARRLFTYFYRLLDKYGDCVSMLVIYTDPRAGKSPALYEYSRLGTKLSFDFL